jgi:hypothetical protein
MNGPVLFLRTRSARWPPAAGWRRPTSALPLTDNPYAAPTANDTMPALEDATALGLASRPYSFSAAFKLATHTFKRRWGTLLYIGLIFLLVAVGVLIPQAIVVVGGLAAGLPPAFLNVFSQVLGFGIQLLIGGPFFAGVMLTAANATLGRSQRGNLLLGFKRYRKVVLANLLLLALAIGSYVVAILPAAVTAGILAAVTPRNQTPGPVGMVVFFGGVGVSLVLLLIAAVVLMRIFFFPVIVADPELGLDVMAALRMSWSRVSVGRAGSLFGLFLVAGLLMMLSFGALCIGFPLLGMPLWLAVLGSAYQLLFRSDRVATAAR